MQIIDEKSHAIEKIKQNLKHLYNWSIQENLLRFDVKHTSS